MTNTNFLPDNYQIPSKAYMKFEAGDNAIRILASPLIGYEYYTTEKKPVRQREAFESVPADCQLDEKGKPKLPKHFWALKVWNYKTGRIEVLQITQISILNAIKNLSQNPKWGSPLEYDIVINKTGTTQFDTEYNIVPEPKTALTESQEIALSDTYINLEALLTNDDPFIKL